MIDFHSHILPELDDGANNVQTSLEMLRISKASGVNTVIATSHCYPTDQAAVLKFIEDRRYAYNLLQAEGCSQQDSLPHIIKASEVHLCHGVSKLKNLDELCIEDTEYILIEMPYDKWQDENFEEIYQLTRLGLKPILAHLDRYMSQEKLFSELLSLNVLCQINASAFLDHSMRKKLLRLFMKDAVHVIGSDMHNLTFRPPNLAPAYEIIDRKFGWEYVDFLQHNSERILKNKDVLPTRLPKLGFVKKIML
ncbi:MAG: hypothetical protein J6C82_01725 [Clostridia bacterium]|nr:hypothetical protein [Clostridia bacterium]